MPKLRVYQLARELNADNSEIIRELQHMGVPVTSHSNTVEDRLADQLRKKLGVQPAKASPPVAEHGVHVEESPVEVAQTAPAETVPDASIAPPIAAEKPEPAR